MFLTKLFINFTIVGCIDLKDQVNGGMLLYYSVASHEHYLHLLVEHLPGLTATTRLAMDL